MFCDDEATPVERQLRHSVSERSWSPTSSCRSRTETKIPLAELLFLPSHRARRRWLSPDRVTARMAITRGKPGSSEASELPQMQGRYESHQDGYCSDKQRRPFCSLMPGWGFNPLPEGGNLLTKGSQFLGDGRVQPRVGCFSDDRGLLYLCQVLAPLPIIVKTVLPNIRHRPPFPSQEF